MHTRWLLLATLFLAALPAAADPDVLLIAGRSMAPLRHVSETLGASVTYDMQTKSIQLSLEYRKVDLTVGRRSAHVDGRSVGLDAPAIIIAGVTYVPLRFISEAFGAQVEWDKATRQVKIIRPGSGKKIILMVKDGPGKPQRTTIRTTPKANGKPSAPPATPQGQGKAKGKDKKG